MLSFPGARAAFRLAPLMLLMAALISCDALDAGSPVTCPGPDAAADAQCKWTPTDHSLIMRVEGSSSTAPEVFVAYGSEETEILHTPRQPVRDGRYEVMVPRLRAETEYSFRVIEVGDDGTLEQAYRGKFTSGSLPGALAAAEIEVEGDEPSTGLVFMDFNVEDEEEDEQQDAEATPGAATQEPTVSPSPAPPIPTFNGLIAIDGGGEIVWYAETGLSQAMTKTPEGTIALVEEERGLKEITPMGDVVNTAPSPCRPKAFFHHEMHVMPDGRLMTLGYVDRDVFNDPERMQASDAIAIWDRQGGEVEVVWNAFDHIDATTVRMPDSEEREGLVWQGCDGSLATQDWTHANSAKVAPDGNVIFSIRHLDQVIAISPDFSGIEWRLGGPNSDFTFPDPADRFYHQHAATQLPNGNILLFDNGNLRPDEEGGEYSRALELELNFEDMTARKVWEYRHDPPLYARAVSNAERLENGNTHVHFGASEEMVLTAVEVEEDGDEVWKARVSAPGLGYIYRSYPGDSIWGETAVD